MLRQDFIDLPEWQTILRKMLEMSNEATLNLRNASDFASSKYCVGMLDAFDKVAKLPDLLFSDGDPKPETKQPEGTVDLPNHPRPSKVPSG